jgi:DNA processing protein
MVNKIVLDWFCLINSKGVGPKTFWSLMRAYKTAEESLKHVQAPFPQDAAIKILEKFKGEIILASDPVFPKSLRRATTCPPMLFAFGDLTLLSYQKIAIIGARNASANGKSIAYRLSSNLSKFFPVVSGLANGIDTSAHMGALRSGNKTIAVVPFSMTDIYPKENIKLFAEIKENGLIITEVPPHKSPDQGRFHARNRIIALLPIGIVVIESSLKSGTMDTAKAAMSFGTKIMAVPGSPSDPRSSGCNNLIKNGAPLIEDHIDVLEAIDNSEKQQQVKIIDSPMRSSGNLEIKDMSNEILAMLSVDVPTNLEFIARSLKIDMQNLLCQISELEILGKVRKCSTNEVVLNG